MGVFPAPSLLGMSGYLREGGGGAPVPTKDCFSGTSQVVQWIRPHLPMRGTRARSLVQEDATCQGATKPEHHNC